jgi:hypothetical protein
MENAEVYWSVSLINRLGQLGLKTTYRAFTFSYQACFFYKSPQIANPQILGLIPISQICKFLSCANPPKVNVQILMINPPIANPQILGLISLSQIRKFLSCANPQNENLQILMLNPQITNPLISQNTAQLCLRTVLRVVLSNDFLFCTVLN